MEEHEVNCSVCLEPFHEELHSPRTLRCGHTFCTPCIEALLQRSHQDRICPECRKPLKISAVAHIPVSYTILRLSRALSSANSDPHIRVQIEDGEACLVHGAPIISWCQPCNNWLCRECMCKKECTTSMNLSEALLYLKQTYVDGAEKSLSILTDKKALFVKGKQKIDQEMLELRQKSAKLDEALKKLDEGIIALEEYEAKAVEASSSRRLVRVLNKTNTYVADINTWLKDLVQESALEAPSKTVLPTTVPAVPTPEVPLSGPIDFVSLKKKLQLSQSMFAVQEKDGKTRWSKLSIHGKNLLLHALDDTPPPAGAAIVSFADVMHNFDPRQKHAFLDIQSPNRYEGRVYLVLFESTLRAYNFCYLCTGEHGPSYKGIVLRHGYYFNDKTGSAHIQVQAGQELVDKDEGKPLGIVADMELGDGGTYQRKVHPGLLSGVPCKEINKSACFNIHLRYSTNGVDQCGYGKVISGLAIFQSLTLEKANNVIIDCGVVLQSLPIENIADL
ncbi:tripartite motif-containing protein 5 isoform X1 [Procambarus clarkii]|uniref:tripartite motif-containing protein 5 isoform X1 n=1 Tax=Procambarus clarkii TaxID=6728 RepID=UPI001E678896|nr:E3 ubiquitin-protein ligase TRIM32-like isoform X1 [Procambarus clarkii]XP_045610036.1 E3 ubiquitin-protein ligase TRIM32-like isoform X1 [Procambarus clarkii]